MTFELTGDVDQVPAVDASKEVPHQRDSLGAGYFCVRISVQVGVSHQGYFRVQVTVLDNMRIIDRQDLESFKIQVLDVRMPAGAQSKQQQ